MASRLRLPAGVTIHDQRGRSLLQIGRTQANGAERVESDLLTGLPTRTAFEDAVERELHRIRRGGPEGCVAVLDLDGFAQFNDRHGHVAGDGLLREIAEVLRASLRRADLAARLGSDEFAILLPDTSVDAGRAAIQRVVRTISGIGGPDLQVSASAGIVSTSAPAVDLPVITAATLLGFATNAMHHAKARRPGDTVLARRELLEELGSQQGGPSQEVRLDARTGLATERAFEADLGRHHGAARTANTTYGLLLADIDHFHEYNRAHGMLAGHDTLRRVATALSEALPQGCVYRSGGEEFAVLLPEARGPSQVDGPGHALVDAVRDLGLEHLGRPAAPPIVTVTAAGAVVDPRVEDPRQAIDRTDRALAAGKAAGRNCYMTAGSPR